MSAADAARPVSFAEGRTLFADLAAAPALVLAVSGGPDSTALLLLAARWRAALKDGPKLLAVTIDHGLRPEAAREAKAVKRLAGQLGVRHRTLRWTGTKPATGLQEAARSARYRLLRDAARAIGAAHILTGHTLDDQAETVLMRMARGSGIGGLGAMARVSRIEDLFVVRPLLEVGKARLVATVASEGLTFANDPSNRDPRFTRSRWRDMMPLLAKEGLDAGRLVQLSRRLRRADTAIDIAAAAAARALSVENVAETGRIVLDAQRFSVLPAELALRLLGRAIAAVGHEGPVQLGKLEALQEALAGAQMQEKSGRLRRTLAGALITLAGDALVIEPAPPRGSRIDPRSTTLTKRRQRAARLLE